MPPAAITPPSPSQRQIVVLEIPPTKIAAAIIATKKIATLKICGRTPMKNFGAI